jgi:transposase
MLHLSFDAEQIDILRKQHFVHPHPLVQIKMEALYLHSQGLKPADVMRICQISKATYYRYLQEYEDGGTQRLSELHYHQPESELQAHREILKASFLANPPASVVEACTRIRELTGIERKPTQVRKFLHSLGLQPRKVGAIPAKADPLAQEDFRKKAWSRVCPKPKRESAPSIS